MDFSDASIWLLLPLQILFVDLLLGADNAIVIALACRGLPPQDVRRAIAVGVGGAILLRLIMTMVATTLLTIPLVKLIGALVLTSIAMNILAEEGLGALRKSARAARRASGRPRRSSSSPTRR